MEEAEQRKHQRRIRRQNQSGLGRQRTNESVSSRKEPGPTEQEKDPQKPFNVWAKMRLRAQRPLGEWLGMTVYTFIGIGVNLAAVTSSNEAATMETQYWAWGFATMIGKSVLTGMLFVRPGLAICSWKYLTLTSPPNRNLHIRRLLRRLPQPRPDHNPHHLPRFPLAPRPTIHPRASARRLLRRSPCGGSLLRLDHIPRRRPATRINWSEHVHPAARLGPPRDSFLLRIARKWSHYLYGDGAGRFGQLAPRRGHARFHHRACRDGHKHGLVLADSGMLQPSP